jgi:hypothetical protein
MVSISKETSEQTHARLLRVIARARFIIHGGTYAFKELPLDDFPGEPILGRWRTCGTTRYVASSSRPTTPSAELFKVFGFHFEGIEDNSGFVGWLASYLKRELGAGLFVVCGHNSKRGGIFDYWGCPAELAEPVTRQIRLLIDRGKVGDDRSDA